MRVKKAARGVWTHGQQVLVYCQLNVTVLRQACQVFRLVFIELGYIEVFIDSIECVRATKCYVDGF
jgi:hypothetical protein